MFGGLNLTTKGGQRPMSMCFLYRVTSQMAQGKIDADRSALSKGKAVPFLDEFMVGLMVDQYGMRELAHQYLCEMYRGLMLHRHASARLRMFAAATGLFPNETLVPGGFDAPQYAILLEVLDATADALDAERALSQCRRDQLFTRWGEMNELFVPARYLIRGLAVALEHEHPELRALLGERMTAVIEEITLLTPEACEKSLAKQAHHARAVVLGPKLKKHFLNIDVFLERLAGEHARFCAARAQKMQRHFRKYDSNADGVFSMEEFCSMMRDFEPEASDEVISDLWRAVGGKQHVSSTLDMRALEEKLFTISRLHKAATLAQPLGKGKIVAAGAAQLAREELSVLVALWDGVRDANDTDKVLEELMGGNWAAIVRMKVWLRLRLERWRNLAHEHQSPQK